MCQDSKFSRAVVVMLLTLAPIEFGINSDNYGNEVYMLPKHLDEKVAKLHLSRLGAELTELKKYQAE